MRTHSSNPHSSHGRNRATSAAKAPRKAAAPKKPIPRTRWYHLLEEPKPSEYRWGPLIGKQRFLAKLICPIFGHAVDPRALHGLALDGDLWIVKSPHRQCCQVYFREQHTYAEANGRRLALGTKQQQT